MSVRSTFATSLRPALLTVLLVVFTFASAAEVLAQRAFLNVPGIPGDSTVVGYVDWINVLSIRQSATATSRRSIACDISVVKNIDIAGPALWATAASGMIFPEMLISVVNAGADTSAKLYDIRLRNVRIGAVLASTGAADASETVTLVPQEVTLTFYTQTPSGGAGTPVTQTFGCQ
jgi:type VI protein secretion system component Hcp